MSCEECETETDKLDNGSIERIAYYRWKNANVAIVGCRKHLLEIFDALSEAQHGREREEA